MRNGSKIVWNSMGATLLTPDRLSRYPGEMTKSAENLRGFRHFSRAEGYRSMVPAMKSSTACLASLSLYWTGGDFMK